ncbi:HTH domain-containing protein [Myxococcota bacterium]|nr:HTH domain-containing protein [Myxococcota bacterium]
MKRSERLFALAEHLRARRSGTTAEAIAERFGVDVRTVFRDLATLRAAGLPIESDRGRGGGLALDRSYSLPPVNLTAREGAVLISAGRWLSMMRVVPFQATLASALDKVQAALSRSEQRELIERLDTLAYVGVPAKPSSPDVRRAVEEAFFSGQPLAIVYAGGNGERTKRRVRLERVVMERSETLLNTRDLDKGEPRQLRLDRIVEAKVLAEPSA